MQEHQSYLIHDTFSNIQIQNPTLQSNPSQNQRTPLYNTVCTTLLLKHRSIDKEKQLEETTEAVGGIT